MTKNKMESNNYYHITTAGTYTLSTLPTGTLHRVVINATAAGTITFTDARGQIAVMKASIAENSYGYDVSYEGFLKVVTVANSDITVSYR